LHHQYRSEFYENPTSGFVFGITSQLATQYQRRPTQNGGMLRKERLQFHLPLAHLNILLKFQAVNLKPTLRLPVDLRQLVLTVCCWSSDTASRDVTSYCSAY
jgi:hypothetical protein